MSSDSSGFLNIIEQRKILDNLRRVAARSPLRESVFFESGDKFSTGMLLFSNIVFWRCGFRAFHLARYNKNRIFTLFFAAASSFNGGFIHSIFVTPKLTNFFREENMLHYGFLSLLAHQGGLALGFMTATGMTFFVSQKNGMLPVPLALHRGGAYKIGWQYYIKALKPYSRLMASTAIGSSCFMFAIGLLEYKQSRQLLAKLNRKTTSLVE